MQLTTIALTAALALAGPQPEFSIQDPGVVDGCLVTLIDEAEVPAQEAGVLIELNASEGQQVAKGDLLARIDDRQSQKLEEIAKYKLDVAHQEAGNDVNVRYATKTWEVAKAEYQQALETNKKHANTIPAIELRRYALKVDEAALQTEQAEHDLKIAAVSVSVRQGELDAAKLDVERRQITAPLDGIVVKRHLHDGEWVRPGDPVLHMVRMDRLRIEAFLDATQISPGEVAGKPVTVTVSLAHGRTEPFPGKVVFVSPSVEAGPRFLVKAEVINRKENDHWLLRPGQNARMAIQWRQSGNLLGRSETQR
ncbi:MAG: HlyD family efflux transporter periplasmic adaptor subunit [Rhodopirellula sp.]|nr:HlyD family efflux transporter periplasmic adaptor subunit [Rhodopirellula sp.]